jgi:hypothetical protein
MLLRDGVKAVLADIKRHKLSLDLLVNVKAGDRRVAKVETVWEVMGALGVHFADLEEATGETIVELGPHE